MLAASLRNGRPNLAQVAQDLGLSSRTLQRRLREQGFVFGQLVEEVRRRLAQSYLDEGRLSVSEVAYLLGYSELSAFSRAYRRWTGAAPIAGRQRLRT